MMPDNSYHYTILGNGDVWLNSGTEEQPRWEQVFADYEKEGIEALVPNFKDPGYWGDPAKRRVVWYDGNPHRLKYSGAEPAHNVNLRGAMFPEEKEVDMQDQIRYECDSIRDMLIDKNESYGNSALDPVRIFSDVDAAEQLRVRIDDKLSRIYRGYKYVGDDDITDLIGYLVLLKIAMEVGE